MQIFPPLFLHWMIEGKLGINVKPPLSLPRSSFSIGRACLALSLCIFFSDLAFVFLLDFESFRTQITVGRAWTSAENVSR